MRIGCNSVKHTAVMTTMMTSRKPFFDSLHGNLLASSRYPVSMTANRHPMTPNMRNDIGMTNAKTSMMNETTNTPAPVGFPFAFSEPSTNTLPRSCGRWSHSFGRRYQQSKAPAVEPTPIKTKYEPRSLNGPHTFVKYVAKYGSMFSFLLLPYIYIWMLSTFFFNSSANAIMSG